MLCVVCVCLSHHFSRALIHKNPVQQSDLVHHGYGRKVGGVRVSAEDQQKADLLWAYFVVKTARPVSMGEHPAFQAYLKQVSGDLYTHTTHHVVPNMTLVCFFPFFSLNG
jgi:hypothetical protein